MTTATPWTIERICDILHNPTLSQQFLGQINRAPAHEMLNVFAKWQGIAEQLLHSAERAKEARAAEEAGLPVPGEWTDITEKVMTDAARVQARSAA